MSQTRYIRNLRPNALNIRVGGRHSTEAVGSQNAAKLSLQLGRRYSRTDSAAISEADFNDTQIQQALRRGHVEEISEESFMTLAARPDQDDSYRAEDEPQTRKRIERDPTLLQIPAEDTAYGKTIVPEFQDEGQRYHRLVQSEHGTRQRPVAREDREKVRRIMTPGLEFVEEPVPTDKELAKAQAKAERKAAPRRKKSE
jgi:hypothetical protein